MSALLASVRAQPTAVETLGRALAMGRVHHAYLFDGPDGVGKELTAFGLTQALVCERRGDRGPEACGECSACARAIPRAGETRRDRLPPHPDVMVLERGLYDPLTIGRRTPETQELSIDQVRTLVLARAAFGPYEGRARAFIVRRAEELSVSAANALLKTLEEPGPRTHFVLLSSYADGLLPTIRSRTQRVRFGALPDEVVASLLSNRGVPAARAAEVARLAGGSLSNALLLSDPETSSLREEFVSRALASLGTPNLGAALELAEEAKKGDKDVLLAHLRALAAALALQGTSAAGEAAVDRRAEKAAARHELALAAVEQNRCQCVVSARRRGNAPTHAIGLLRRLATRQDVVFASDQRGATPQEGLRRARHHDEARRSGPDVLCNGGTRPDVGGSFSNAGDANGETPRALVAHGGVLQSERGVRSESELALRERLQPDESVFSGPHEHRPIGARLGRDEERQDRLFFRKDQRPCQPRLVALDGSNDDVAEVTREGLERAQIRVICDFVAGRRVGGAPRTPAPESAPEPSADEDPRADDEDVDADAHRANPAETPLPSVGGANIACSARARAVTWSNGGAPSAAAGSVEVGTISPMTATASTSPMS